MDDNCKASVIKVQSQFTIADCDAKVTFASDDAGVFNREVVRKIASRFDDLAVATSSLEAGNYEGQLAIVDGQWKFSYHIKPTPPAENEAGESTPPAENAAAAEPPADTVHTFNRAGFQTIKGAKVHNAGLDFSYALREARGVLFPKAKKEKVESLREAIARISTEIAAAAAAGDIAKVSALTVDLTALSQPARGKNEAGESTPPAENEAGESTPPADNEAKVKRGKQK